MNITDLSASYIKLKAGVGKPFIEIIIDNPIVELFLIPALIFLMICLGIALIILVKKIKC